MVLSRSRQPFSRGRDRSQAVESRGSSVAGKIRIPEAINPRRVTFSRRHRLQTAAPAEKGFTNIAVTTLTPATT
jgi:hypothetical protein